MKTGLARDILFVSSASRICELKKPCSGFFKLASEIKLWWKTCPHVNFGPFFGTKRWVTLEQHKISKIANNIFWEKTTERKGAKFLDQGIGHSKVKRKRRLWKWTQRTASFMYNFVQKTNATKQIWCHFIPTSPLAFFTRFSPEDLLKRNFKKRPKRDFHQKSNF